MPDLSYDKDDGLWSRQRKRSAARGIACGIGLRQFAARGAYTSHQSSLVEGWMAGYIEHLAERGLLACGGGTCGVCATPTLISQIGRSKYHIRL